MNQFIRILCSLNFMKSLWFGEFVIFCWSFIWLNWKFCCAKVSTKTYRYWLWSGFMLKIIFFSVSLQHLHLNIVMQFNLKHDMNSVLRPLLLTKLCGIIHSYKIAMDSVVPVPSRNFVFIWGQKLIRFSLFYNFLLQFVELYCGNNFRIRF